jgi:hypothetical protein
MVREYRCFWNLIKDELGNLLPSHTHSYKLDFWIFMIYNNSEKLSKNK